MTSNHPIGVFDSGVGGLSVLRQIRTLLPHDDLIYVADTAFVPYGEKPATVIEQRSLAIAEFLMRQPVKAIVVACNTATAAGVAALRERYGIPILGMEPAVKPAVALSRSGVVGVLATSSTLNSTRFTELLQRFGHSVEVINQPCPGLVGQVERGELDTPATRELLGGYLEPLLARGADALALGCTHYPFLMPLIAEMAGPGVSIIDTGPAVARHLRSRLEACGRMTDRAAGGTERFYVSGEVEASRGVMERLWGAPVELLSLPSNTQKEG